MTTRQQEARAEEAVRRVPAIVCAVRESDVDTIARMLLPMRPAELHALVVVMAAAIDPSVRLRSALAWVAPEEPSEFVVNVQKALGLRPCGTHAAHVRHRAAGEEPCDPCWDAERTYQRLRGRDRRAEQTARDSKKGQAA